MLDHFKCFVSNVISYGNQLQGFHFCNQSPERIFFIEVVNREVICCDIHICDGIYITFLN